MVDSGAIIKAPGQVTLSADTGALTLNSVATGNTTALGGHTTTKANDNGTVGANVTAANRSDITTSALSVVANSPAPSIDTNDPRTTAAVDTGSATESAASALTFSANIDFNSTVTIVGVSPQLLIGPDGYAITDLGVNYSNNGQQITVENIDNTTNGTASLSSKVATPSQPPPAEATYTNQLSGNPIFDYTGSYDEANITNESNEDLVIQDINVVNANVVPTLTVTPSDSPNWNPTNDILATPFATEINILNTGSSNIILSGAIQNPVGITNVSNTGGNSSEVGNITSSGAGQSIQTGQVSFNSTVSSLGTSANPLNAQLVQSASESAALEATAPQGNVYLNVSALNQTTNPLVVTSSDLTGQTVDLQIGDGASQTAGQTTTTPETSTYNLSGVAATQAIDAVAGRNTAVHVNITAPADLNVGTVKSTEGDVSLTSTNGSIFGAAGSTATNVIANKVTLSAPGGTIGTASQPFDIDSGYGGGAGVLSATAAQGIYLDQTTGNLSLGVVSSEGLVEITSAGQIFDGEAGVTNLTAPSVMLMADMGIGTSAMLIQTDVQDLAATADFGNLWIDNSGDLTIAQVGSETGLNADGAIDVSASGELLVDADVTSTVNDVTLAVLGPPSGDDLLLVPDNIEVKSSVGSVTLDARLATSHSRHSRPYRPSRR